MTRFHGITLVTTVVCLLILAFCTGVTRLVLLTGAIGLQCVLAALGVCRPRWQMFGRNLCHIRTDQKVVALTFDDGPDPENTPVLLALLSRQGVRATFFCVGERVARHPELVARAAADGHLIENHSYGHSRLTNFFSVRRLRDDVRQTQAEITRATGRPPAFFRPPMGLTNWRVFRVAQQVPLTVVGWTTRGLDQHDRRPEAVVARILRRLQPGAIVLLHDGGVPVDRLLAVVEKLIDRLRAQGYECLRLDELISREEPA